MFKLRHKSGTLWICRHPHYRLKHSLIFLKVTQTNVSVTDAAETWDYVASTVVIVWMCSNCIRIMTEVWKVPGEKPAQLPIFFVITLSYSNMIYDMIWYDMIWYDMIWYDMIWYDMIYLLTAIGLSPGGSSTVHIYTQTIHRTIQNKQYIEQHNNWKSAGRAPSWLVIPWHLPYNRGKSMEKPQSG